jgi:hypothetical protein
MRNLNGRIRRLEQGVSGCPGDWGPIPMYRCREGCEDRIPKPDPRCRLCGLEHDPPAATEANPRITSCLVIIPADSDRASELGEEGWKPESDFWPDWGKHS